MGASNVIDLAAVRKAQQKQQRATKRARAGQPRRLSVAASVRRDVVRLHAAAAL